MAKYSKNDVQAAMERLHKLIRPGDTIYCILRHVSSSGMSRNISLYTIDKEGATHWLDYSVAVLLGYTLAKNDGIKVSGCGMDMGFHLVYSLSSVLFRESGFTCIGKGCPASDHANGDRNYEPHEHSDPGYALKHHWL